MLFVIWLTWHQRPLYQRTPPDNLRTIWGQSDCSLQLTTHSSQWSTPTQCPSNSNYKACSDALHCSTSVVCTPDWGMQWRPLLYISCVYTRLRNAVTSFALHQLCVHQTEECSDVLCSTSVVCTPDWGMQWRPLLYISCVYTRLRNAVTSYHLSADITTFALPYLHTNRKLDQIYCHRNSDIMERWTMVQHALMRPTRTMIGTAQQSMVTNTYAALSHSHWHQYMMYDSNHATFKWELHRIICLCTTLLTW